jgi:hypothetical protein
MCLLCFYGNWDSDKLELRSNDKLTNRSRFSGTVPEIRFVFRNIVPNFALVVFIQVSCYICHILRRNCILQRFIEGKIQGRIEVTGRQGRRRRKLLDDLKERRGHSHLKEEALDRTMWRAVFGRGFGPVVRQTAK